VAVGGWSGDSRRRRISTGLVIDRAGHQAGFVAATACVLALAVVVWIGRRRMAATVADTPRPRHLTNHERG
jgi:hypothetical protein